MAAAAERKVVLSGVKPTGVQHLGNYFGALKQFAQLQDPAHELFVFIADYHAMTTVTDAAALRAASLAVALDYLAIGLDPEGTHLFRQSDVPEVTELSWILACHCPKGMLDRAHAFKEAQASERAVNVGLFTYPVLMAADILIYGSHLVPVGQDQKQHVEYAQDLQEKVNHAAGTEVLVRPEPLIQEGSAVVMGLDGRKMSKSYGNTIEIFEPRASFEKKVSRIVTDSTPVEEPKDPDTCRVFALYRLFDPEGAKDMALLYRAGGFGYGHAKKALIDVSRRELDPLRERRRVLEEDPRAIEGILRRGGEAARTRAAETMVRVRKACGLG